MRKPKFYLGRAVICPGEMYDIDGVNYKIVTATTNLMGEDREGLLLSDLVYYLENIETKELSQMSESELRSKFVDYTIN